MTLFNYLQHETGTSFLEEIAIPEVVLVSQSLLPPRKALNMKRSASHIFSQWNKVMPIAQYSPSKPQTTRFWRKGSFKPILCQPRNTNHLLFLIVAYLKSPTSFLQNVTSFHTSTLSIIAFAPRWLLINCFQFTVDQWIFIKQCIFFIAYTLDITVDVVTVHVEKIIAFYIKRSSDNGINKYVWIRLPCFNSIHILLNCNVCWCYQHVLPARAVQSVSLGVPMMKWLLLAVLWFKKFIIRNCIPST